jgi:LPXTG-motif cell wall-anchored protein
MQVSATGPMTASAAGMRLSVARCSVAWSSLSCPAGDAASVLETAPIVTVIGGSPSHVTYLGRTGSTHLLVRITLPTSAGDAFVGTQATVRLVLTAAGDEGTVGTGPDPTAGSLAATGISVAGPALLGVGILTAGLVVASRRRRGIAEVLA